MNINSLLKLLTYTVFNAKIIAVTVNYGGTDMIIKNTLNLEKFINKQNPVWKALPHKWQEAPFLANGFFGCTVYFDTENKKMILALGHTCVYDNRPLDPALDETLIKIPRLPVGNVEVSFAGTVTGVDWVLDIFNAELRGEIFTDRGSAEIRILSLNDTDCIVCDYKTTGSESLSFDYKKSHGGSPRVKILRANGENAFDDYDEPKAPDIMTENGKYIFVQPYFCGGGFGVCTFENDGSFFVSVSDGETEKKAEELAVSAVEKAVGNTAGLIKLHREWWHAFYKKSFVSLNDGFYENFYNIQLYKLACASRENGRPFDTCGPWLTDNTRWPGTWWNLNVELTVSPLYTSNHIDIAKCVSNALKNHFDDLVNNVPERYRRDCAALGRSTERTLFSPVTEPGNLKSFNSSREGGNLIWALFYCYTEYKMTGNETLLTGVIYPLLKRAVQYYLYFLYTGDDGRLHLKATLSPEYLKSDSDDVNYDLSLLRWGLIKLCELSKQLGTDEEKRAEWQKTLDNLTDFPQTPGEGLKIARDTPYAESHRHYSHILSFYPLHVLDRENEKDRALVNETIDFWQSKPKALLGYSQTGAASMRAMLREGNKALKHLDNLMNGFVQPNTMYHEDGNPVLETPPSAATAMLEMLLQSHDGYIEFFPAVPDRWQNICFDSLRCEGGFEAGAEYKGGSLAWIKIKKLFGGECRVKADFGGKKLFASGSYRFENGFYIFDLKDGEEIHLGTDEEISIHAVETDRQNCFGLH